MNSNKTKNSFGVYGVIFTCIVLIAALGVNLLFSLLPDSAKKFDLSTEKLTVVSEDAKEYIKNSLDSEVTIYLVAETGMEDASLSEFLKNLCSLDQRLSFKSLDPTVNPATVKDLTGESTSEISDNTVIIRGEKYDSVKTIVPDSLYIYEMFILDTTSESYVSYGEFSYREFVSVYASYSDYFDSAYAYYTTKFNGETTVISAIDYVLTNPENLPKIYFTSTHGESSISESLEEVLLLANLPSEPLILSEGVPNDAAVIVINAPEKDLSKNEAESLSKYLSDGGKIFLTTSYENIASLKNLSSVLSQYGLSAESNELFEKNSSNYYPGYENYLLPSVEAIKQLYNVKNYYFVLPSAHAIKTDASLENITHTALLQTSESAFYITEENGESKDSEAGLFTIGVSALSTDGGEILWISSPSVLTDDSNDLVGGGNYSYFTAMLSSLSDKNTVSFAAKIIEQDTITTSSAQASFWAIVLIAVIPCVFIICGIVTVRKRRRV